MMENIPSIPMCDQWLAENDKIRANLLSMKARIAEQESMLAEQQSRQAGRGHMDYDKDDMDAWGNDRDHLNGGMSGPKRHRVGFLFQCLSTVLIYIFSELHHQEDVIAATEQKHLSGDEVQTVLGLCVMLVDCIMQN
jgi:hypothetical protein